MRALREASPAGRRWWCRPIRRGAWCSGCGAPLTEWPDMLSVGSAGDPARTEAVGRALGSELAALGIGWDFAPVLDVHTNPANPVIGNRAFGRTPPAVVAHALAFWRGLRAAGVLGCGKHFPGHGDTHTDSHHELPVVDHDAGPVARGRAGALRGGGARRAIEAIMTAHVMFPALDPERPATLSRRILTDSCAASSGFAGLIVSDDLGMKAVADRWPIEAIVTEGLMAGSITSSSASRPRGSRPPGRRWCGRPRPSECASGSWRARPGWRRSSALRGGAAARGRGAAARLGPPAHQALAASFRQGPAAGGANAGSPVAGD